MDKKRCCTLLGVEPNADRATVRRAYLRAVKRVHPDLQTGEDDEQACRDFCEIREAYATLISEEKENLEANGNAPADAVQSAVGWIEIARYAEAEAELNAAPLRSARWYYLKGLIRLRMQQYADAIPYLRSAASMDPENWEYKRQLRFALNHQPLDLQVSFERFWDRILDF